MDHYCPCDENDVSKSEKGQVLISFLAFFPVFVMALFLVIDFGRFLYLRNQVRITADSAALAAAGALDIRNATNDRNFIINAAWADFRANEVLVEMQGRISEDSWMTITIPEGAIVNGNEVTVIVEGTAPTIFGKIVGKDQWVVRVMSSARVAVGVNQEW